MLPACRFPERVQVTASYGQNQYCQQFRKQTRKEDVRETPTCMDTTEVLPESVVSPAKPGGRFPAPPNLTRLALASTCSGVSPLLLRIETRRSRLSVLRYTRGSLPGESGEGITKCAGVKQAKIGLLV